MWAHFEALRVKLTERQEDFKDLSAAEIVSPFLTVVRSASSSIVVRSTALHSLEKFFVYGIIRETTSGVPEALRGFTASMAKCRDSVSESSADHLILVRMLLAIQAVTVSPCGRLMDDVGVCELLEIGLSLCCQMRLDESIRRMSENCMTTFVRVLFSSLRDLEEQASSKSISIADPEVHVTVHADLSVKAPDTQTSQDTINEPPNSDKSKGELLTADTAAIRQPSPIPTSPSTVQAMLPYGPASLHELLRVLISLCDPHNLRYTDTIRMTALNILLAAIETGGSSLGHFGSLRRLIVDDLLAYTFQLIHTEKILLLNVVFKVIVAVFDTLRPYVTRQFELLVDLLLRRLKLSDAELLVRATRHFSTTEYRLRLLDTLVRVSNLEALAPTLWLNYDCQLSRRNMVDALLAYLCTVCEGTTGRQCQRVLIQLMETMVVRATQNCYGLEALKAKKRLLHDATSRFNHSPKEGVRFLQEHGIIPAFGETVEQEKALAHFFQTTPDVNKTKLGEFLANQKSQGTLEAFMRQFDFRGKRIDEALRLLLESFRLPGESQQIDRIVETFSRVYFELNPEYLATQEATYVLAFSIILLNTDLHSPQVKYRMKIEDYMRNLRGVNGDKDFDIEFLTNIYNVIRDDEILMPEEHEGQLGFMYAWKEMVHNAPEREELVMCMDGRYDRILFKEFGRTFLTLFGSALERANTDAVLELALDGIRLCAELSSIFDMSDVFDTILPMLAGGTGLVDGLSADMSSSIRRRGICVTESTNDEANTENKTTRTEQVVPVTALSIRFGRDYKAQLITVHFFRLVSQHGNRLRDDGWMTVLDVVMTAFRAACLPESLTVYEDSITGEWQSLPFKIEDPASLANGRESSIFSALSNYLMPTYDPEADPVMPEEISAALNTLQCFAQCPLNSLSLVNCTLEDAVSIRHWVVHLLTWQTPANVLAAAAGSTSPANSRTKQSTRPEYDPLAVFALELAVQMGIQHPAHLLMLWNYYIKRLEGILEHPSRYHPFMVQRAVFHLFQLCQSIPEDQIELFTRGLKALQWVVQLPADYFDVETSTSVASCMKALITVRLSSIIQVREQQDGLASLIVRCMRVDTAIPFITTLIDAAVEHTNNLTGFGFGIELLTSMGLGSVDESKLASLRIRSPPTNKNNDVQSSPNSATLPTQSPPNSGKNRSLATERALQVVERLFQLSNKANELSMQSDDLRENCLNTWCPLLNGLARLCIHPIREVRFKALGSIDRLIYSSGITIDPLLCLDRVLFPMHARLIDRPILTDNNNNNDDDTLLLTGRDLSDVRLRVYMILCKYYLHHLQHIHQSDAVITRWTRVLDATETYMLPDGDAQSIEAVGEQIKNMLMVMHALELFSSVAPPSVVVERDEEEQQTSTTITLEVDTTEEVTSVEEQDEEEDDDDEPVMIIKPKDKKD
ncbi:hypothetical protein BDF19DRAFT_438767 [Syncephalis fuscata]|nr:hypothetical protein BDF19DRAFT_438767 [Syncephalis fuscata]